MPNGKGWRWGEVLFRTAVMNIRRREERKRRKEEEERKKGREKEEKRRNERTASSCSRLLPEVSIRTNASLSPTSLSSRASLPVCLY